MPSLSSHEHRLNTIETNVHELETRTNIGAHNLEELTSRVDAIGQSLTRIETSVTAFLGFWETALKFWEGFLRFVKWVIGILTSAMGGLIIWYISTHWPK